jgi:2-keto-3-deoxy-L-rhamnonate aldolase RhmA
MEPNPIRRRWQSGLPALGTFVFSSDPASVEIAGRAVFDFATIDLEHAPLTLERAAGHIRAATAAGIAALVRVADGRTDLIARLLDAGAHATGYGLTTYADYVAYANDDVIGIGLVDLSTSLGSPGEPTHPEVTAAARRRGLRAGMYLNSAREVKDWLALKLDFYVYLIDTKVLAQAYAAAVAEIRTSTTHG